MERLGNRDASFGELRLAIVLTLCGKRRRYIPGFWIRFTVWSTYLSGSVAKVIIGKLSGIEIKHIKENVPRALDALLAPLLLVQLGNPDTITAYSIEDNRLGLRQFLNLIFQVGTVVYILIRHYLNTPSNTPRLSFVYLPMFLSGIIKYGELVWALKSALKNSVLTVEEIGKQENVSALFSQLPRDIPGLELILKAYYRFDCLKPHLENWFYNSFHECLPWMSIDAYSPEGMFKIIDAELGFMRKKSWSNSLGQFNLLSFCLHDKQLKFSRIIKFCGLCMEFRKSCNRKRVELPNVLKEVIVQELKEVDQVRDPKAITQRGQWALERYGCLNQFRWSVKRNFDKSITLWHIATDICYDSDIVLYDSTVNSCVEMSELLSNYMMYLLALRPHMLCTTTADAIFHHAYTKLMKFLRTGPSIIRDEHKACGILGSDQGLLEESDSDRNEESIIDHI
ncbi:hypothetical protein FH972_020772 [Carpinus fangiana]|uniref:DUF4220 domain-containing protein n=1 Tax=Carpinus fangiana TaxID=176857 RepID=A0A5N6RU81_9ROSI|nr:hypothetical protein FH972_020772 [Carpinus fangiana]